MLDLYNQNSIEFAFVGAVDLNMSVLLNINDL